MVRMQNVTNALLDGATQQLQFVLVSTSIEG